MSNVSYTRPDRRAGVHQLFPACHRGILVSLLLIPVFFVPVALRAEPISVGTVLIIGSLATDLAGTIVAAQQTGADPSGVMLRQQRRMLTGLQDQMHTYGENLTILSGQINDLPREFARELEFGLDKLLIDELYGVIKLLLADIDAYREGIPFEENRHLWPLQFKRATLMRRSYINAPAIISALRYELAYLAGLDAPARKIELTLKEYHEWLEAALDKSRDGSLESRRILAHRTRMRAKSLLECERLRHFGLQVHLVIRYFSEQGPGSRTGRSMRDERPRNCPNWHFCGSNEAGYNSGNREPSPSWEPCEQATIVRCKWRRNKDVEAHRIDWVKDISDSERWILPAIQAYYGAVALEFLYEELIKLVRASLSQNQPYSPGELPRDFSKEVNFLCHRESLESCWNAVANLATESSMSEAWSWSYGYRCDKSFRKRFITPFEFDLEGEPCKSFSKDLRRHFDSYVQIDGPYHNSVRFRRGRSPTNRLIPTIGDLLFTKRNQQCDLEFLDPKRGLF